MGFFVVRNAIVFWQYFLIKKTPIIGGVFRTENTILTSP